MIYWSKVYFTIVYLLPLLKNVEVHLHIFVEFWQKRMLAILTKISSTSNYICTISIISHHLQFESIPPSKIKKKINFFIKSFLGGLLIILRLYQFHRFRQKDCPCQTVRKLTYISPVTMLSAYHTCYLWEFSIQSKQKSKMV